jgi:hypothetical protein
MLAGSVLIVYHLGAVVVNAMAAPSGPWPMMEGADMAIPPQLAAMAHEKLALPYLRAIKQTHNYHFRTNRVGNPEAFLEIQLQEKDGSPGKTLRFPDPKAPSAVRQRQASLVRWFIDDQPVQPKDGESVRAPGAKVPEITIWEQVPNDRKLNLTKIPEHEARDYMKTGPLFKPTPWSLLVLRSLTRHLVITHDADSADIVRHSKEPIPPRILTERENPPDMEVLLSNYGRMSK